MKGNKKQVTVTRKKRLALDDCQKLGLPVQSEYILSITARPHGSETVKGQGWDELIAACKHGEVRMWQMS